MSKGGIRPGAGRKVNSGVYGEKTIAKRVPVSMVADIEAFIQDRKVGKVSGVQFVQAAQSVKELNIPLFASRVAAGFPSPADDFLEAALDLNQYLIQHPAATFFVRASGNSMLGAGIHNNDILVVDRSQEARHGSIVIAVVNGELTVKRLHIEGKKMILKPENSEYSPLTITEEMGFQLWGVVTSVIHEFKGFS